MLGSRGLGIGGGSREGVRRRFQREGLGKQADGQKTSAANEDNTARVDSPHSLLIVVAAVVVVIVAATISTVVDPNLISSRSSRTTQIHISEYQGQEPDPSATYSPYRLQATSVPPFIQVQHSVEGIAVIWLAFLQVSTLGKWPSRLSGAPSSLAWWSVKLGGQRTSSKRPRQCAVTRRNVSDMLHSWETQFTSQYPHVTVCLICHCTQS